MCGRAGRIWASFRRFSAVAAPLPVQRPADGPDLGLPDRAGRLHVLGHGVVSIDH